MAGTSPAMTQLLNSKEIVMPGFVPGIHGTPTERQPLLNSLAFPQFVRMHGWSGRAGNPYCSNSEAVALSASNPEGGLMVVVLMSSS
jgi:hypothetical protein